MRRSALFACILAVIFTSACKKEEPKGSGLVGANATGPIVLGEVGKDELEDHEPLETGPVLARQEHLPHPPGGNLSKQLVLTEWHSHVCPEDIPLSHRVGNTQSPFTPRSACPPGQVTRRM